jgi:hypothetical protein
MYRGNYPVASSACLLDGLSVFGGWKPPSDETLSAALGLAITTAVAIRLALETPRSGDIVGVFNACWQVHMAATLLISHFKAS